LQVTKIIYNFALTIQTNGIMRKWKVEYKEVGSDRIRTTTHTGNLTKEQVIVFFGLNNSDVSWYDVTEITE
jgi:hypothetical protein